MPTRLPLVLSVLALAAALLAAAPVGGAAVSGVRHALFADDAARVGGIRASRTPRAGYLVPLNAKRKLPAGVVPTVAGPRGPAGRDGVGFAWHAYFGDAPAFASVQLGGDQPDAKAGILDIPTPEGRRFVLLGRIDVTNTGAVTARPDCRLWTTRSWDDPSNRLANPGPAPDRGTVQLDPGEAGQIVLEAAVSTFDGSDNSTIDCSLNGAGQQVALSRIALTAIQVDSLD